MNNGDGLIRSLVDRNFEGFRQKFESFLDQCPSFLYHVSAGGFVAWLLMWRNDGRDLRDKFKNRHTDISKFVNQVAF